MLFRSARWTDFHHDNNVEKLYYLEVNFDLQTVHFQHKNNCTNLKTIFHTASEISKLVKQVRHLFETTAWAEHFNQHIDVLRQQIVSELMCSNQPLAEIKRSFLH